MHRRIGATVVAALLLSLAPSAVASADDAQTMQDLVLGARARHGVAALATDGRLVELARRQAVRMRDAGGIFHNPSLPDELRAMTNAWTKVGENVGEGPTVAEIQDAFMASATHAANVTNAAYNAIGIAVAADASGRLYVAQVFAGFVADRSTASAAEPQRSSVEGGSDAFTPVVYFPTACAGVRLRAGRMSTAHVSLFGC